MAGVMVSVATGVMNSVVDKLTTLLGNEFILSSNGRRGIRFMRDELSSMNAALQRLADMDDDQIDVQTKEWRSKVRELSYNIEDCIDRFMLNRNPEKDKVSFVKSMARKIKMLWEDQKIAREIQELKALVVEEKIGWLRREERQLKLVSIFGIGGQGKTTLAMEVYRKIEEPFDCRASVTVSRTHDIKKLLRDILFQINKSEFDRSEGWELEQLIPTLREYLTDKSGCDGHMYEAKPLSEDDSSLEEPFVPVKIVLKS